MQYLEALPANCPPQDAKEIVSIINVFRLVKTNPPTLDDFQSQRTKQPNRHFPDECIARGISVWEDASSCQNVCRLPYFKGSSICRIELKKGAGYIREALASPHKTWWPFRNYPILNHCKVVKS